jgi:hypothetical protein
MKKKIKNDKKKSIKKASAKKSLFICCSQLQMSKLKKSIRKKVKKKIIKKYFSSLSVGII